MANQLIYKGYTKLSDTSQFSRSESFTKIYTKQGLARNNMNWGNSYWKVDAAYVIEYELVPTGRKFNKEGKLIE